MVPKHDGRFRDGGFHEEGRLGGLPAEEKPLLSDQAFGAGDESIKNVQMASTSPDSMFENELNFFFKENASFRAEVDERYSKVSPPWDDSLHHSYSLIRVVGEPSHIPRFVAANETFSCNIAEIQEVFYPFL